MASLSMPVRLSLGELCAAALLAAADDLAIAADTEAFLGSLDANHRLWRELVEAARYLPLPPQRPSDSADFVIAVSRKCGQGVRDEQVEALIEINRQMASRLAGGADPHRALRRAELAWRESGLCQATALRRWLTEEIQRKARHHGTLPESSGRPAAAVAM